MDKENLIIKVQINYYNVYYSRTKARKVGANDRLVQTGVQSFRFRDQIT